MHNTRRGFGLIVLAGLVGFVASAASAQPESQSPRHWFRGNLHTHSLWSDGNNLPELVADVFKSHGYQFLVMTDHNVLMRGERWKDLGKNAQTTAMLSQATRLFGPQWLQTRTQGGKFQVRLKTLDEIRQRLEEPGRFLMIEGEEITTGHNRRTQIHVNMLGCGELIKPLAGTSESDVLAKNVAAVHEQSRRLNRLMLPMANHPNWPQYSLTAEDLAQVDDPCLLEILNPWEGALYYGNAQHPGHERLWDIANTLRLAKGKRPLFGTATDDSHDYFSFGPLKSNPLQAWVMVRAPELTERAILTALREGDFYFTNGVTLEELVYDAKAGELRVSARAEPGVKYYVDFYGTLKGCDLSSTPVQCYDRDGKPGRASNRYSPEIGKLLMRVPGATATYKLTGKELFVRAVVRSDRKLLQPPEGEMDLEEAYTQPVGWKAR